MGDDDREVYKALKQINREHRSEEIVERDSVPLVAGRSKQSEGSD